MLRNDVLCVLHVLVHLVRVDPGVLHDPPLALAPLGVQLLSLGAAAAPQIQVPNLRLGAGILAEAGRAAHLPLRASRELADPRVAVPRLAEGAGRVVALSSPGIPKLSLGAGAGLAGAAFRIPDLPVGAGGAFAAAGRGTPELSARARRVLAIPGHRVPSEALGARPRDSPRELAVAGLRVSELPLGAAAAVVAVRGAQADAGDAVADADVALGQGGEVLPLDVLALPVLPRVEVGRLEDGVFEPVGIGLRDGDVHVRVFAAKGVRV